MKTIRMLLAALGLLLLGFLVGKLGLGEILQNLSVMGWSFGLVLLLALGWHVTNTIAWSFAFPADAFRPRLVSLFMSKLAGDAVNQLTPLANLGGEPIKAYLLRQQSPTSRGLASVVINKTAQVFTGLVFTALGLSLVILNWDLPQSAPMPVQIGLALLFGAAALLLLGLWRQQRHMFSSLLGFVRRLGIRMDFIERRVVKAVRIDDNISSFYRQNKARFALVLLFHACGWMLGACETWIILRGLGQGVDFDIAFLLTSLTVIINSLFFFMPSNIGVLEGGQVFLFMTLGLDPAVGLSLGIVKRMRKIFWISIGWLLLTHLSRALGHPDRVDGDLVVSSARSGSRQRSLR